MIIDSFIPHLLLWQLSRSLVHPAEIRQIRLKGLPHSSHHRLSLYTHAYSFANMVPIKTAHVHQQCNTYSLLYTFNMKMKLTLLCLNNYADINTTFNQLRYMKVLSQRIRSDKAVCHATRTLSLLSPWKTSLTKSEPTAKPSALSVYSTQYFQCSREPSIPARTNTHTINTCTHISTTDHIKILKFNNFYEKLL